jgi:hypothetical protein
MYAYSIHNYALCTPHSVCCTQCIYTFFFFFVQRLQDARRAVLLMHAEIRSSSMQGLQACNPLSIWVLYLTEQKCVFVQVATPFCASVGTRCARRDQRSEVKVSRGSLYLKGEVEHLEAHPDFGRPPPSHTDLMLHCAALHAIGEGREGWNPIGEQCLPCVASLSSPRPPRIDAASLALIHILPIEVSVVPPYVRCMEESARTSMMKRTFISFQHLVIKL